MSIDPGSYRPAGFLPSDQGRVAAERAATVLGVQAGATPLAPHVPQVPHVPGRAPVRPPALSAPPDAMGLLKALRRRWAWALFGGVASALLAGAAAYLFMPPLKYKARSMVYVSSQRPKEIFDTRESVTDYKTFQETQSILVTSHLVLSAALKNPTVARLPSVLQQDDPIAWLGEKIKVDFPRGSEILSISVTDQDPQESASLVNAVTDAYLKQIVLQERKDRVARFERLKSLFNRYQKELQEKRKVYRELAESVGPNDKQSSALKQQTAVEHMSASRQELMRLQGEIRQAQVKMKVLEARQPQIDPRAAANRVAAINKMVEDDAEVIRLRERIGTQTKQLHNVRGIAKKGSDPTIKRLDEEIAYATRALRDRRRSLAAKYQQEASQGAQDSTAAEMDEIRQYVDILQEQEKSLKTQIAEMDSEMRTLNVKSIDLHWIEDEITVAGDVAKTVGTEVESMNVELEAPPRIRLIEPARIPGLTDPLRKVKIVGIVGFGGLVAFLGALSLWEHRARRIDTVDEVVHGLGIKLLGALPALPARRQSTGKIVLRQRLLIESIDAVRTLLLHLASRESLRVVMVTSAVKGEGKTSLSCHLATSLARAGHKVLLVDSDLRHPSSHRVLNETLVPGLCEYLRGECGVEEAIRLTQIGMLYLLPAGQCDPLAIEGLARVQFGQLLLSLRSSFDFIIVDSSPLLPVSDSLIVSQHVDAVLFSILREVSRVPDVHAGYEKLSMLGVRILGAVVAGIHEGTNSYGYNYTARTMEPLDPAPAPAPGQPGGEAP